MRKLRENKTKKRSMIFLNTSSPIQRIKKEPSLLEVVFGVWSNLLKRKKESFLFYRAIRVGRLNIRVMIRSAEVTQDMLKRWKSCLIHERSAILNYWISTGKFQTQQMRLDNFRIVANNIVRLFLLKMKNNGPKQKNQKDD